MSKLPREKAIDLSERLADRFIESPKTAYNLFTSLAKSGCPTQLSAQWLWNLGLGGWLREDSEGCVDYVRRIMFKSAMAYAQSIDIPVTRR